MEEDEHKNGYRVNYGITINSKEGSGSRTVTAPPGPCLREAPDASTIHQSKGGRTADTDGGWNDSEDDPGLVRAIRVFMEEQRAR